MKVLIATGDPAEPFRPVEVSEAIESLAHHQVKFQTRLEALEKTSSEAQSEERWREAAGVLAQELVSLKEAQTAMAELLKGVDARVRLLTLLIDRDREILERAGLAKPRPKEDPLAN